MNVIAVKQDLAAGRTRISGEGASQRSARMMISSAGRRVSLLRCFRESAQNLGIDLDIFACDLQPEWSAACADADKFFTAPPAESDAFVPAMLEICEQESIGLIVPTIDTELVAYAQAREQFAAIGTSVAVSDLPLVTMARDKLATARFLAQAGIASPRTAAAADFLVDQGGLSFPLLAKPRGGSSSRGIAVVENETQIRTLEAKEPYVLQEILEGPEFTVSIYFDSEGQLKSAVPHERLRVRSGEVEKGTTVRHSLLEEMARQLAQALHGARGALCFQTRMTAAGLPSMFEINARFGGGYPLAHQAGATFTRWTLEEWLDLPSSATAEWRAGVRMLRYDDAIFL
ncbi:MAG: ATP-grasp domain-containing protein [Sphingobium sp.]|uniref:ATP-grasp domain-containing protein n=1 Tax=Sphingobium sp. TaxID=1912891 RepID=UPI0029A6ABE1|nr:ATP-grasp domain-containing protein [Sphingobium sp.]MDX3909597.1 ATP-grasp domain-containing protein [Sphingobium sp.]